MRFGDFLPSGELAPFEEYYSGSFCGPITRLQSLQVAGRIAARQRVAAAAAQFAEVEATKVITTASIRASLPLWMKGQVAPPKKSKRAIRRERKAAAKAAYLASDEVYWKSTNGLSALPSGVTRDFHDSQLAAMEIAYLAHVGNVGACGLQRRQALRAAYKARCEKRAFRRFMKEVDFLRLPVHIVDKIQIPCVGEQAAAPEMPKGVAQATSSRQTKVRRSFSSFLPKEDFSFTLEVKVESPLVTPTSTQRSSLLSSRSPSPRRSPSPPSVFPDRVVSSSPPLSSESISMCSHGDNCTKHFCFGFLDLKNERNASLYLQWLLKTQLPGDIFCFDLDVSPYLEQCTDTMEAIDLWWHAMDRYRFNFKSSKYITLNNFLTKEPIAKDQTPYEFLAKQRALRQKTLKPILSRKEKLKQRYLVKSEENWDAFIKLKLSQQKEGQGPWQFVKDTASKIYDAVQGPFNAFVNRVVHALNPLTMILGPFKNSFWEAFSNLKSKCIKLVNDHWLAFAVGSTLVASLIFLFSAICLCKVFVFLVHQLGLPLVSMTFLVTSLVVAFFLFNGFLEQAADLQLCSLVGADFLNFLNQTKDQAWNQAMQADLKEEAMQGQGISWCFSALYKLVSRIIPGGCKEASILFNSVGSISRNANHAKDFFVNMKEMAVSWMDAISDALALLGDDSVTAIHVLKHLCEHDFLEWAKKVERYAGDTYDSMIISPSERLKIIRILVDQQEGFQKAFFNPRIASKAPRLMLQEFQRLSTILRECHSNLSRAALFDMQRVPPFWVHLYSENGGTGKSMAMMPLGNYMLDSIEEPKTHRFVTRNVASRFMNGYLHQPCFLMDEFGAAPKTDYSDEVTMLDLISPNPLILNMAALGDKNIMFTSKLVISTANRRLAHPDVKLGANLDGFLRRRNILAEVQLAHGKEYFHEFVLLQPRSEQKLYLDKALRPCDAPQPLSPSEFYAVCAEQFVNFLNSQSEALHVQQGVSYVRSDDFSFLKDFLAAKMGLDFQPCEIERIVTDYALSVRDQTLFPAEHELVFMKWRTELDSLTLSELVSMLDKSVTETFVYTLIKDNHSNVVMSNLTPYECLIYSFCKKKYKQETDVQFAFSTEEVEQRPWFAEFLSFTARVCLNVPKWVTFILALCAFLFVAFILIKFAIHLFSGAMTLLGVMAFSTLSAQGPEDSPAFENARKSSGVRFEFRPSSHKQSPEAWIKETSSKFASTGPKWADMWIDEDNKFVGEGPENQNFLNLLKHQVIFVAEHNPSVSYNALAMGNRNFLFTKHVWDLMPTCNYTLYGYAVHKQKIYVNTNIRPSVQLKDRDLTLVCMPDSVPPFTNLPKDLFLKNLAEAPKVANAHLVISKVLYETRSVAKVQQNIYSFDRLPQVHCKDTYSCGSLGSKKMPPCYSYTFDTYAGMCSSPLISMDGGRCVLLGLHVVGDKAKMGYSQIITLDDFSDLNFSEKVGEGPEQLYIPTAKSESFGSVSRLGKWIGPKPYFLESSSLVPSLISTNIDIPRTTEPAILSVNDPRFQYIDNKDFDPFIDGMKKYAVEAHSFEEEDFFEDALDRVFSEIPEFTCEDLTNDQVCNGIEDDDYAEGLVMQTAEGYPFCTQRPAGATGKSWLFAGGPGDWHIIPDSLLSNEMHVKEQNLANNIFSPIVGIDFPKDEKVNSSKVYQKPKTRLFTILPVDYNILVRKYFLSFVSQFMARHNEMPTKVGIDATSNEWSILYHSLRAKGNNWFNGDYTRFDGITPRSVLIGIVRRINKRFCNKNSFAITDKTLSINGDSARIMLMDMASTRYGLTNGDLWYVTSGIPSGFPLTVIVNSLVNQFFIHFTYLKLMKAEECKALRPLFAFKQLVNYAVYGDDNLVSVHDTISDRFNLVTISDSLRAHGVTLKNGANKDEEVLSPFYPCEKVDFLKRKFSVLQGHIVAPLNPVNITERLHWIRKGLGAADATLENCKTAMFEAMFHGEGYYNNLANKILLACKSRTNSLGKLEALYLELPTYQDALSIFLAGGSYAKAIQSISLDLPGKIIVNMCKYFSKEVVPGVFYVTNERNVTISRLLEVTTMRNICYISRNYESRNSSRGLFTLKGESWTMAPLSARLAVYKNMAKPIYFVDEANDGLAMTYVLDYMLRILGFSRTDLVKVLDSCFGGNDQLCHKIISNFAVNKVNIYIPPCKRM
uniref:Replicase n=1 Tax=Babaco cheravirus 1 TaxID=2760409 RepID=A0A7G4WFR3_9SECO|nr:replicase [Babaco cheravirus 1]